LALSDPSDLDTIDTLHHLLKAELELKVASDPEIDAALNKYYGAAEDSVSKMIQDITEGEVQLHTLPSVGDVDDGATVDADAPIIKLVNTIIVEAFRSRASQGRTCVQYLLRSNFVPASRSTTLMPWRVRFHAAIPPDAPLPTTTTG